MIFDDAVRVRVIRAMLGRDSRTFAENLGISPGTLTSWERGRSTPRGLHKRALEEICRHHQIGFTPTGFPLPMADCMMFKPEENNG